MQRAAGRCSLSLAKQQPSLSNPLCLCCSPRAGSKAKVLNQAREPTRLPHPGCERPPESVAGIYGDCRQPALISPTSSSSQLWGSPWRGLGPWLWVLRARRCQPARLSPPTASGPLSSMGLPLLPYLPLVLLAGCTFCTCFAKGITIAIKHRRSLLLIPSDELPQKACV